MRYKYKVCKGRKVLALSTTLHEAEAEARRVGGRVLPLENVLGKSSASPSEHVAQTSTLEPKPKNPQAKKSQRLSRTQQKKYLGDLKGEDREARAAEILYRREHRSNKPFVTDKGQTTKHSTHAAAFAAKYGRPPKDTADAAKLARVPKKVLDEVYARGLAAWQTGHRPGASQHAWAMARVESFLTGGPTSKTADADLARMVKNPERTFIPPPAVAAEAREALALRAAQPPSNKCCTPVGIARAKQLANRQPVSETTLRRMKAYFDRHAVDAKGKGWKVDSKGWQAWLAWGGDSGREWCEKLLRGL